MALNNAQFSSAFADVVEQFINADITGTQFENSFDALLDDWTGPRGYLSNAELAEKLVAVLGRIDGLILADGAPAAGTGSTGAVALDYTNLIFYGPKPSPAAWGSGVALSTNYDKPTPADTTAALFKTAGSPRARHGLIGNDNLSFQTSPDGITWTEGLRLDKDTGEAHAPQGLKVGGSGSSLDVFEQGLWTPEVADAATGGNVATVAFAFGSYLKIGKLVHVWINLEGIDPTGLTGTNLLYIRDLPFACGTAKRHRGVSAAQAKNLTFLGSLSIANIHGTSSLALGASVSASSELDLIQCGDAANSSDIQAQPAYRHI